MRKEGWYFFLSLEIYSEDLNVPAPECAREGREYERVRVREKEWGRMRERVEEVG